MSDFRVGEMLTLNSLNYLILRTICFTAIPFLRNL